MSRQCVQKFILNISRGRLAEEKETGDGQMVVLPGKYVRQEENLASIHRPALRSTSSNAFYDRQ